MLAVVIVAVWTMIAMAVALVIGGAIRMADRRAPFTDHLAGLPADLTVEDILGAGAVQPSR
jgi:hypothetical protein